ncbi:MAG: flagellar hook-length control protein FliK [Desulfurivibrionaceae bacterium]
MDALMLPIVQASKVMAAGELKSPVDQNTGSNFSDYMEKKMATERQAQNNLLGVQKNKSAAPASAADTQASGAASEQKKKDNPATDIAALLGQFVQTFQQAASDQKPGPGQWSFSASDQQLLQKMAKDAGMNDNELTALMEQLKNQGGKMSLSDLLAAFSHHFQTLQTAVPVTAPETDLPLLQNFLERLGVSVPEVSKISEAAVRGDSTIDLQKLLDGLQGVSGQGVTALSAVESEQLQNFLANAGVSQQLQRALLPERLPVIEGLVQSGPPVTLTMERLKEMLAQGIQEINANRVQAAPLPFLKDLQQVLAKSGFEATGPSLSPAVQGSLASVFEKLMQTVDLAKVKVQQGIKDQQAEAGMAKKDLGQWLEGVAKKEGGAAFGNPGAEQSPSEGKDALVAGASANETGIVKNMVAENGGFLQASAAAATAAAGTATAASSQAATPLLNIPNMPQPLQQQTFAQLSQGVLDGLNNQEHHLVLKLYPKELGEVRVEMSVRDNQVALSFSMENSKVKEILEKNLDQFKQNMEKQGFALGQCNVSLNKNNDSNESWQQYQAGLLENGTGQRRTTPASRPEDIFYQRAQPENGRESGVDLFA